MKTKIAILILMIALVISPKIVFAGNEPIVDEAIQKTLRYIGTLGYNISEKDLIISRQEKDNVIDIVISIKVTPYKKWILSRRGMPRLAWINEEDVVKESSQERGKLIRTFSINSSQESSRFDFTPIRDSGSPIYGHKLISLTFIILVLLIFPVIILTLRVTDPILIFLWIFYYIFSFTVSHNYIYETEAAYSAGGILIGLNIPILFLTILYSMRPLMRDNRDTRLRSISIRNRKTSLIVPLFLLIELLIIFNEFESDTFVLIMAYIIFGAALLPLFSTMILEESISPEVSQPRVKETLGDEDNRDYFTITPDGLREIMNEIKNLQGENQHIKSELELLKDKKTEEINKDGQSDIKPPRLRKFYDH